MWFAERNREQPPKCTFRIWKQFAALPGRFKRFCDTVDIPLVLNICVIFLPFHAHTRYYPCI